MKERTLVKNHRQERHLVWRRSFAALIIVLIFSAILLFRIGYLQLYKHNLYETLATQNWLDLVPIEPSRGLVYDRNGVLLADNIPVFSLDITPFKCKNIEDTIYRLKRLISLTETEIAQFHKQMKQGRRFDEIPLKVSLSEVEVARFLENQYQFQGVAVHARLMRHYPFKDRFSHILGYVGRINTQELRDIDPINYSASHYIGKSGIEKHYETVLHGNIGYQEVENDATGRPIRILKTTRGKPGVNLKLTIDSKLQMAAEEALTGYRGAAVAMDPRNGEILAMVSIPSFDPNLFVLGISQRDYQALRQSKDRPLYNRALRGLYPPASTIKPYLALAGLHYGLLDPDEIMHDPGWFQIRPNSRIFHDWKKHGHGTVDLGRAIESSCDIYFYKLGLKLGSRRMHEFLRLFGFGEKTTIDLDDELSGILPSHEWKQKSKGVKWYDGDTLNFSIGQGFAQTTPLQLAHAVSIIAMRGDRITPHLVLQKQVPGKQIETIKPSPKPKVALRDAEFWEIIIDGMQNVVDSPRGTAYRFNIKKRPFTVAGKTGTAQVVSRRGNPDEPDKQENLPEKWRDHHFFVAFAPVEAPEIALAVISENSNVAIETARAVFDQYFGVTRHDTNTAPKDHH